MKKDKIKLTKKQKITKALGKLIAFITLYFAIPSYSQKNKNEIFITSLKMLLTFKSIAQLKNGDYLTLSSRWDNLSQELIHQGYSTEVFFYEIKFWKNNQPKKCLKGTKINNYIVLWKLVK